MERDIVVQYSTDQLLAVARYLSKNNTLALGGNKSPQYWCEHIENSIERGVRSCNILLSTAGYTLVFDHDLDGESHVEITAKLAFVSDDVYSKRLIKGVTWNA